MTRRSDVPLYIFAVCREPKSYAISLIRLFTLVFSSSLGFKDDPSFCIFCMPVLDNDTQYVHYLLLRPLTVGNPAAHSEALGVVWPVSSPTATLSCEG